VKGVFLILLLAATLLGSGSVNCSYLENPAEFEYSSLNHWNEISRHTDRLGLTLQRAVSAAEAPTVMPRKTLIDEYIFGRMERDQVRAAPITDDQTFARRVYLDLTGRIPSPAEVRSFAYDSNGAKRDVLIDS
jgi:hypothetical protein